MQQTMAAPIQELNQAIQTLARSVEELKRDRILQPISDEFEFERFNEMPTAGLKQDVPPDVEPDDSMLGLRWFASWRQGASMKGAA
jgi:predicted component of type VI protein secretion system